MILSRDETLVFQTSTTARMIWGTYFAALAVGGDVALAHAHNLRQTLIGLSLLTFGTALALRHLVGFSVTIVSNGAAIRVRQMYSTSTIPLSAIGSVSSRVRTVWHVSRPSLVIRLRDGSDRRFKQIVGSGVPEWSETGSTLTPAIRELNDLITQRARPHGEVTPAQPELPEGEEATGGAAPNTQLTARHASPPPPSVQPVRPGSSVPVDLESHVEPAGVDWMLSAVAGTIAAATTVWLGAFIVRSAALPIAWILVTAVPAFLAAMFAVTRVARVRMNRMLRLTLPALNAAAAYGHVHAIVTILPAGGARFVWIGRPGVLTIADDRVVLDGTDREEWPVAQVAIGDRHRPGRRSGINLCTPDGLRRISFAPAGDPTVNLRYVLDARLSPAIRRALEHGQDSPHAAPTE